MLTEPEQPSGEQQKVQAKVRDEEDPEKKPKLTSGEQRIFGRGLAIHLFMMLQRKTVGPPKAQSLIVGTLQLNNNAIITQRMRVKNKWYGKCSPEEEVLMGGNYQDKNRFIKEIGF